MRSRVFFSYHVSLAFRPAITLQQFSPIYLIPFVALTSKCNSNRVVTKMDPPESGGTFNDKHLTNNFKSKQGDENPSFHALRS